MGEEDEIRRRQNQALLEDMRGQRMEPYLACWIYFVRAPAGMSVLGSYLGSVPPLPALVLANLPSGGMIGKDNWPPSPDFLKIIDMQDPNSAKQQTPTEEVEEEEEVTGR
ncbi:thioredoxin domain-containing protein 16-like [Sebastes fasciatus]|uniref:thioredoxin domain-containing protein 16-like n=1 Tax=Sebastes fasciatus TaxID=394691 RepID=UPI003D9ED5E3